MNSNVVHPSDNPPEYADQLSSTGPSTSGLFVKQSMQQQPQPSPSPQSAWNDPNVHKYPPPTGPCPYGQPLAGAYPPPAYGTPEHRQQQQIVLITACQHQPITIDHTQSFAGQIILACIVTWLCNCPFGLVAFILAGQSKNTSRDFYTSLRRKVEFSACLSVYSFSGLVKMYDTAFHECLRKCRPQESKYSVVSIWL